MKFIWKIENFSLLKCQEFISPPFSHFIPLEVTIHPQFDNPEGSIMVKLKETNDSLPNSYFNCSFALLGYEGSPFVWEDVQIIFNDDEENFRMADSVSADLIKRKKLFGSKKSEFLPNDILTVQCCIWRSVDNLVSPLPTIFARSRVEPREKILVKKFHCIIPESILIQPFTICHYLLEHEEPIMSGETLDVSALLYSDKLFHFDFCTSIGKCKMEVEIFLLDAVTKKKVIVLKDELDPFDSINICDRNSTLSRNMILSHKNLYMPNNTLTLHFIFSFSEIVINRIADENEILNIAKPIVAVNEICDDSMSDDHPEINQLTLLHPSNTISQSLPVLLQNGFLSDFNITVGDRVFPVHKAILGLRSQVFRAMFTTDMKEKEDNCVDIPDIDEDTLQRLLQFVYSDRFDEDMGWERACSLYAAADKYAVESLRQKCSTTLKSELCVSSVLEVLSLADMHQDKNLTSTALDFISLNDRYIIGTEHWRIFEKENAKLALAIWQFLYVKKMYR